MRLVLLVILFLVNFIAKADTIGVITNDKLSEFMIALEAMIHTNPEPKPTLKILNLNELDTKFDFETQTRDANILVTTGYEPTLYTLLKHPKQPILATGLHEYTFNELKAQFFNNSEKAPRFYAIVIDQPIKRSLNLIRSIIPKDKPVGHIGILLGQHSKTKLTSIDSYAQKKGLCLNTASVDTHDNPSTALNYLINNSSILLAIPDQTVYNQQTAQGILVTALRKNVPLIAYSKKYVDMGALASVYSTPTQIAQQTAETLLKCEQGLIHTLPKIQFPNDFKVEINYEVAKNFGLSIQSSRNIKYTIEDFELPDL